MINSCWSHPDFQHNQDFDFHIRFNIMDHELSYWHKHKVGNLSNLLNETWGQIHSWQSIESSRPLSTFEESIL